MISGVVTPDREPVIQLRLRGVGGLEAGVQALIDTGFTIWDYMLTLQAIDNGAVTIAPIP